MRERDLSGRVLGEFILRDQIGRGGYGAVYRGEQLGLDRAVVVKVLHEWRDDEVSRGRFLREAKLASKLQHPYAAHVYASGIDHDDDLPWIAMELVQGVSLRDWLMAHGPMPLEQFVPFFECIAEAVQAAHEQGIVHRDLKPSNIMVIEQRGGRLSPKLLDFGIAKMLPEIAPPDGAHGSPTEAPALEQTPDTDKVETNRLRVQTPDGQRTPTAPGVKSPAASGSGRRLTPSGACLGSRPYMALEQWHNAEKAGPAADIYSLGVVAYEALTGKLPFTADNSHDYLRQHRFALPPLLSPPEVNGVIQTALAKYPGDRQKSVLDMASGLRRALQMSRREQLRSSAQQWDDQGRAPGLLWGPDVLADVLRQIPLEVLSPLECSFVAASQRRARRTRRVRRSTYAVAVAIIIGGFLVRATMQTRAARQVTEATITQSELEQGRSALLHDEPEASIHLGRAYQHGEHSASTRFMLAIALQSRLTEQARLTSSYGRMWSAAFSPNGRQIVTTDDGAAQVWDAQTGKPLFALPYGGTVYEAVYSADGTRLVVAGGIGSVKIWDAASGALVRELRRDDASPRYFAVVMSPDARLVAAIDTRGDVSNVWDATTGELIAEIRNDASKFPAIAFSADGHWLATTGGADIRVFDAQARRQVVVIHEPRIRSLAFDPTGPRLLTGAATGHVAIWSVLDGARVQHLRDVKDPVNSVAFSPDGQLVAAGSRDGAVQVWRAASGELQAQLNLRHSSITAVEFDRASRHVLAAGVDGTVVVANAVLGMPDTVLEAAQGIQVAHFDPSSRRVVGASLDGTALVWDATSTYRRWGTPPVADDCGLGPNPEPDQRFIAVGCRDHTTRVWDTAHDQLIAELPSATPVSGNFVSEPPAASSAGGRAATTSATLVSGSFLSAPPAVSIAGDRAAVARGATVELYELPGGQLLRSIAHGAPVSAVAFTTTGRDVVSGATDGSLLITRDGGARVEPPASPGGIDAVGFLSDGRVITADAQRRLRVYDRGGAIVADVEIPVRVMSLRVSGDRLIAVPIAPPIVDSIAPPLLVDLEHYRVIAKLEGHIGRVFSARWVAADKILTTGSDGTVRLWDGSNGQLRHVYRGRSRIFTDTTLTVDGFVMASGTDGLLQLWDQDSELLLWVHHAHAAPIIGLHVEGDDIVTRGITGELARWRFPNPGQVIDACSEQERCAMLLR
jgi:WD40 repeat protein/serine/threonine protein kinase